MLKGIFIILLYLFIGEVAGYFTGGFMPGSVFGMIFLFISLKTGIVKIGRASCRERVYVLV